MFASVRTFVLSDGEKLSVDKPALYAYFKKLVRLAKTRGVDAKFSLTGQGHFVEVDGVRGYVLSTPRILRATLLKQIAKARKKEIRNGW